MTGLRWLLGLTIVLLGVAFVVLNLVAGGFRKSFGASEVNPLLTFLPLAAMGLLLAGLIYPEEKIVLHVGAAAAVGLVAFCLWQIVSESATVLWFALAFLLLWLAFYGLAAWQGVAVRMATPANLIVPNQTHGTES